MDFTGALVIKADRPFEEIVPELEEILGLRFSKDSSGRYDEFPAYVANVVGIEIALLGLPKEEDLDEVDPVKDYSILVQTEFEAPDHEHETDVSTHLAAMLNSGGITCSVGHA